MPGPSTGSRGQSQTQYTAPEQQQLDFGSVGEIGADEVEPATEPTTEPAPVGESTSGVAPETKREPAPRQEPATQIKSSSGLGDSGMGEAEQAAGLLKRAADETNGIRANPEPVKLPEGTPSKRDRGTAQQVPNISVDEISSLADMAADKENYTDSQVRGQGYTNQQTSYELLHRNEGQNGTPEEVNAEAKKAEEPKVTPASKEDIRSSKDISGKPSANAAPDPSQGMEMVREQTTPNGGQSAKGGALTDNKSQRVRIHGRELSKRNEDTAKRIKKNVWKRFFRQKDWSGKAVYGHIFGDHFIQRMDVAEIGIEAIRDLLDVPDSGFLDTINNYIGQDEAPINPADPNALDRIIGVINTHDIYVGLTKSPVQQPEQSCKLILKVVPGDGIGLHAVAVKMLNADFDGDDATILFDQSAMERYPFPTAFLVNTAGQLNLDESFFPRFLEPGVIAEVPSEGQMKKQKEYARRFVEKELKGLGLTEGKGGALKQISKVAIDFYFAPKEEREDLLKQLVRTLWKAKTKKSTPGFSRPEIVAYSIVRIYNTLHQITQIMRGWGEKHFSTDELPAPMTYNDRQLYKFNEELYDAVTQRANKTANFQDLRALLSDYLGEPKGTNPSFRFTASIGKFFQNYDPRIEIGENVKLDDEIEIPRDQVISASIRYVESQAISNRLSNTENEKAAKETFQQLVIQKVGYPDMNPETGRPYDAYEQFLDRFIEVYEREESVINLAASTIMTDMSFSDRQIEKTFIKPIAKEDKDGRMKQPEMGDIARSLLFVYGDETVSRMLAMTPIDFKEGTNKYYPYIDRTKTYEDKSSHRRIPLVNQEQRARADQTREELGILDSDYYVSAVYGGKTLWDFRKNNCVILTRGLKDKMKNTYHIPSGNPTDVPYSRQPDSNMLLLYALADMRTSQSGNFDSRVYGNLNNPMEDNTGNKDKKGFQSPEEEETAQESQGYKGAQNSVMAKLLDLLMQIDDQLNRSEEHRDNISFINDLMNLVAKTSPDLFAFYGMDNAYGFFHDNGYGQAMMKVARNLKANRIDLRTAIDLIGSIRYAMVTEMQLNPIRRLNNEINELVKEDAHAHAKQIEWLENKMAQEREILSSSSMAWKCLVREIESPVEDSVFTQFKKNGKPNDWPKQTSIRLNQVWNLVSSERLEKYDSIIEVLTSLEFTKTEKMAMASDIVRYYTKFYAYQPFQISQELEMKPASVYSSESASAAEGASDAVMKVVNDFNSAYYAYKKRSFDALNKNIYKAKKNLFDDPNVKDKTILTKSLKFYANHPECYIECDDYAMSDAICSVMDKVYKQTEKNSQHPWMNFFYSLMSFIRSFGYFSDVYHTDDKAIGVVAVDKISPYDIICVLSGEKTLFVYNKRGRLVMLNQQTLVALDGNEDEGEKNRKIWDFLLANPRVASCLRTHKPAVIMNNEGEGFLSVQGNIESFIKRANQFSDEEIKERQIKYKLWDDPSYHALTAITTPTHGHIARALRQQYPQREKNIRTMLINAVRSGKSTEDVLTDMKLDLESIKQAKAFGDQITEQTAIELYNNIKESVTRFLQIVKEISPTENMEDKSVNENSFTPPDLSACYAYYDVRQEFSGSKTAISVGVEGSETVELAAFISLLRPKDRYTDTTTVSRDIAGLEKESYDNLKAQFGDCMAAYESPENKNEIVTKPLKDISKDDLIRLTSDGKQVIIEPPADYEIKDKTLDNSGNQTSSVCAYLIVKRDHGAEKFNLQAKKTGDDGLHSVTKRGKYFSKAELDSLDPEVQTYADLRDKTQAIFNNQGAFQAHLYLAKRLMEINHMYKYTEMTFSDCSNLADLMIVIDEDGQVRIRSIRMIAYAIKSKLTDDIINKSSIEELHNMAVEAAQEAGLMETFTDASGNEKFDVADVINHIPVHAPLAKNTSSMLRPRSSGWGRNHNLLQEIEERTGFQGRAYGQLQGKGVEDDNRRRALKALVIDGDEDLYSGIEDANYKIAGVYDTNNGSASLVNDIGPDKVFVVLGDKIPEDDTGQQNLFDFVIQAYSQGATLVFPKSMIDAPGISSYKEDSMPFPGTVVGNADSTLENYAILPFFDIELNGSETAPAPTRIGVQRRSAQDLVFTAEDPNNTYALGDASMQIFKSLYDRIKIKWSERTVVRVGDIFKNLFEAYPYCQHSIRMATPEEVANLRRPGNSIIVDYGVASNAGKEFMQHRELTNRAIDKYYEDMDNDPNNYTKNGVKVEAEAGDMIGWLVAETHLEDGTTQITYAPLIPFDLKGTNNVSRAYVPRKFKITGFSQENDNVPMQSAFIFDWVFSDSIAGRLLKFFEGQNGANKMIASTNLVLDSPMTKEGLPIDGMYSPESTASRRVGTNKRLGTLQTLILYARYKVGYNFAIDSAGSFPVTEDTNQDLQRTIKEKLATGYILDGEWQEFIDQGIVWHSDPQINDFVDNEVRKAMELGMNPTQLLCSYFSDGGNGKLFTDITWDYESMFSASINYQDNLMRFFNSMMPTLCAKTINDHGEDYVFRCAPVNAIDGFQSYCMQMKISVKDPLAVNEGESKIYYYNWMNVYAGFSHFNFKDFTGAHRTNVNGSSDFSDAVANAYLADKRPVSEENIKALLHQALYDVGDEDQCGLNSVDVDYDSVLTAIQENQIDFNDLNDILPKIKNISFIGERPGGENTPMGKKYGYNDENWVPIRDAFYDILSFFRDVNVNTTGDQGTGQIAWRAAYDLWGKNKDKNFIASNNLYMTDPNFGSKWRSGPNATFGKDRLSRIKQIVTNNKNSSINYVASSWQKGAAGKRDDMLFDNAQLVIALCLDDQTAIDDETNNQITWTGKGVRKAVDRGLPVLILNPMTMMLRGGNEQGTQVLKAMFGPDRTEINASRIGTAAATARNIKPKEEAKSEAPAPQPALQQLSSDEVAPTEAEVAVPLPTPTPEEPVEAEESNEIEVSLPSPAPESESEGETISSFRGKYAFLSNFYDGPHQKDGVFAYGHTFRTAENAFQACKAIVPYLHSLGTYNDKPWEDLYSLWDGDELPQEAHEILASYESVTPKKAKSMGRKVKLSKEELNIWNDRLRDSLMLRIVRDKFKYNDDLTDMLINTYPARLVEGNDWGDTYWGVSNGRGQNQLGIILEIVRDQLMEK